MELEIYDRQGALKRKVSPDSSSRWTEEVGAEFVVTVNFTTWEFFVLSVGDYVEISGKRFSIKKEYRPKKTDTQKYTYNISFYGREHDMQDLLFCRLNQGEDDLESVFAYDGTPMEMLEKLVFRPSTRPASIGPPLTKIVGIFSRAAAISRPGTFLSQLGIHTRPSN